MDTTKNGCEALCEVQISLLGQEENSKAKQAKSEMRKQKKLERQRIWRAKNREYVRQKNQLYRAAHREQILAREKRDRQNDPEKHRRKVHEWSAKHPEYSRQYHERKKIETRLAVMNHYGAFCRCCGETELFLLSIDHKENGRGNAADRSHGTGEEFYAWLKRTGYPAGPYQVLCLGCNQAKGFYGSCPHTKMQTPIDKFFSYKQTNPFNAENNP